MRRKMKKIGVLAAAIFLACGNIDLVEAEVEVALLKRKSDTLSVWWTLPEASKSDRDAGNDRIILLGNRDNLDFFWGGNDFGIKLETADVKSDAVGVVTGEKLYNELHLADGTYNYINQANTTGANLSALETELKERDIVNVTSSDFTIDKSSTRDDDKVLNTTYTITTESASFESGNTGLVTGGGLYEEIHVADGKAIKASNTVAQNLIDLDAQVKTNTDQVDLNTEAIKNLKDLSNLTDAGKKEIKNLAQGVVKMKGDNVSILVEDTKDETTGNLTYKVTAKDALVESGNTGILTADNAYTEFRTEGNYIHANQTVGTNLGVLDAQIKTNADSIIDLENRIGNKLDVIAGQINSVAAGAAAMAALQPEAYRPENRWSFAVGYGHYKNENATAMGVFFKPEAMATFSVGGTVWSGDPMLSAGASFKAGRVDQEAKKQEAKNPAERVKALETVTQKQEVVLEAPTARLAKWEAEDALLAKRLAVLEREHQALQADGASQMAMNRTQEKELEMLAKEMTGLQADREKIQSERIKLKERFTALLMQMEMVKGERP